MIAAVRTPLMAAASGAASAIAAVAAQPIEEKASAKVAIRVLGSWTAATGLLLLGWSLR